MEEVEYLEEYEDVVLTQRPGGSPQRLRNVDDIETSMIYNSFYFDDSALGGEEIVEDVRPFQMEYQSFQDRDSDDSLKQDIVDRNNRTINPEQSHSPANSAGLSKQKPKKRRVRNVDAVTSDEECFKNDQQKGILLQDRISFKQKENEGSTEPRIKKFKKNPKGIKQKLETDVPADFSSPISSKTSSPSCSTFSGNEIVTSTVTSQRKPTFTPDVNKRTHLIKTVAGVRKSYIKLTPQMARNPEAPFKSARKTELPKSPIMNKRKIIPNLNLNRGSKPVGTIQGNINNLRNDNKIIGFRNMFSQAPKNTLQSRSFIMGRPRVATAVDNLLSTNKRQSLPQQNQAQAALMKRIRRAASTPNLRDPLNLDNRETFEDVEKDSTPRKVVGSAKRNIQENPPIQSSAVKKVTFVTQNPVNSQPLPQKQKPIKPRRKTIELPGKSPSPNVELQKRKSVLPAKYLLFNVNNKKAKKSIQRSLPSPNSLPPASEEPSTQILKSPGLKQGPTDVKSILQKSKGSPKSVKQNVVASSTADTIIVNSSASPADVKSLLQKSKGSPKSVKQNVVASSTADTIIVNSSASPADVKSILQKSKGSPKSVKQNVVESSTADTTIVNSSANPADVKSILQKIKGSPKSVKQNVVASSTADTTIVNSSARENLPESVATEKCDLPKKKIPKPACRVRKRPRIIKESRNLVEDKIKDIMLRKVKVRIKKYEVQRIFAKSKKLFPKATTQFRAILGDLPITPSVEEEQLKPGRTRLQMSSPEVNDEPSAQSKTKGKSPQNSNAKKVTNIKKIENTKDPLLAKATSEVKGQELTPPTQNNNTNEVPSMKFHSRAASKKNQQQLSNASLDNCTKESTNKNQSDVTLSQSSNLSSDLKSVGNAKPVVPFENVVKTMTIKTPKRLAKDIKSTPEKSPIAASTPFAKGPEREVLTKKPQITIPMITPNSKKQTMPINTVQVENIATEPQLFTTNKRVIVKRFKKNLEQPTENVVTNDTAAVIYVNSVPGHVVVETRLLTRQQYMNKNLSRSKLDAAGSSSNSSNSSSTIKKPVHVFVPPITIGQPSATLYNQVTNKHVFVVPPPTAQPSITVSNPETIKNVFVPPTTVKHPAAAVSNQETVVPATTVRYPSTTVSNQEAVTQVIKNVFTLPPNTVRQQPKTLSDQEAIKKVFAEIQHLIDEEVSREVTRKLQQISEGFTTGKMNPEKPRIRKFNSNCDLNTANTIHAVLREYFAVEPEANKSTNSLQDYGKHDDENCILPDSERTPVPQQAPVNPSSSQIIPTIQNRTINKRFYLKSGNVRQMNSVFYTPGSRVKRVSNISRTNKRGRNKSPDYFRFRKIRLPGKHNSPRQEGFESQTNVAKDHTYSSSHTADETDSVTDSASPVESSPSKSVNNQEINKTVDANATLPNPIQCDETILQKTSENVLQNLTTCLQNITTTTDSQNFTCNNIQTPPKIIESSNTSKSKDNLEDVIVPDVLNADKAVGEQNEEDSQKIIQIEPSAQDNSSVIPVVVNETLTSSGNGNGHSDYEVVVTRHLKKVLISTTGEISNPAEVVISDFILSEDSSIANIPTTTTTQSASSSSHKTSKPGIFIITDAASRSGMTDPLDVDLQYTEDYSLDTGYQFKCDHCEIIFSSRPLIQDHVQRTHYKSSKDCYICGLQMDYPHLMQHFLDSHSTASISR